MSSNVSPLRIAVANCSQYLFKEKESASLIEELSKRGVIAESQDWADKSVDWSKFDCVIIRSTWDYHERYSEFMEWIDHVSSVSKLINTANVIRWNSNKKYLLELESKNVAIVPSVMIQIPKDINYELLEKVIDGKVEYPIEFECLKLKSKIPKNWTSSTIVLKPAISASAHMTLKVDKDDPESQLHVLRMALDSKESAVFEILVQPFLPTICSHGETSLIYFGKKKEDGSVEYEMTHAIRKVPANGDFRVQTQFGGSASISQEDWSSTDLAAFGRSCLQAIPFPEGATYARVDICPSSSESSGQENRNPPPLLMELELIEPFLFTHLASPQSYSSIYSKFAEALLSRIPGRK